MPAPEVCAAMREMSATIGEIAATAVRRLRATNRMPMTAVARPAQSGRAAMVGTRRVYDPSDG